MGSAIKVLSLFVVATASGSMFAQTNTFPASGSAGVGTTSPTTKLQVVGNVAIGENTNGTAVIDAYNGDALYGNNLATNGIAVDPSGHIGIGTMSPSSLLTMVGAPLSSTSGSVVPLMTIEDVNGNTSYLNISEMRYAAGTNWLTSTTRIQQVTDVTPQGYIDFNPPNGNGLSGIGFGSTAGEMMRIVNQGFVGIGTTSPGSKLEVNGNVKLTAGSGASMTFQDGSVQTVAWNGILSGGDYAESIDVDGEASEYEPGDVLVIDPDKSGRFLKCSVPYATTVAGVYSTNPGVRGRRQKSDQSHMKDEVPMAMIGVVPTKVTAENGPIRRGDLLVSSSRSGYAMRGSDREKISGAIIGKAMDSLDSGTGLIEVLVSLQ